MSKHTTFEGPIAARIDRVIDRWLKLANRRAIGIDRGRQLCTRLDLALDIAERLSAA
jgi:hypothetical protein